MYSLLQGSSVLDRGECPTRDGWGASGRKSGDETTTIQKNPQQDTNPVLSYTRRLKICCGIQPDESPHCDGSQLQRLTDDQWEKGTPARQPIRRYRPSPQLARNEFTAYGGAEGRSRPPAMQPDGTGTKTGVMMDLAIRKFLARSRSLEDDSDSQRSPPPRLRVRLRAGPRCRVPELY
jgi:hypothetical protein